MCAQQTAQKKPLDIYFLDTEGGQATLFVSPSGQSMLVDTGFPGNQGAPPAEANAPGITRDADRIMAVLKLANVDVLDYMVITHFHGGPRRATRPSFAHRIPTRHYVDRVARTRSKCSRAATLPFCLICRFANMRT